MDGPWQMGHLDANAYGLKALEAAKMMKWQDPTISLVAAGSSGTQMPTYPEWDRVVMEHCWEQVDYLSLHYYAGNWDGDTASYLALAKHFENHIDTLAGTLRYVKAKRRSQHDVYLSLDEWQVWYKDRSGRGGWTEAPHLSEEIYNLEDALVVAQWLNVFLRRADVLKAACVAQIVNVISWLQTTPDALLKQPSFYPFMLVSTLARGNALDLNLQAPVVETKQFGAVPVLDVAGSVDAESGKSALFIVNRSQTDRVVAEVAWQDAAPAAVDQAWQMAGSDVKAVNSFAQPDNLVAKPIAAPRIQDGKLTLDLPPLSFTALSLRA
jgi:alpha-N-arabinofuranosidase